MADKDTRKSIGSAAPVKLVDLGDGTHAVAASIVGSLAKEYFSGSSTYTKTFLQTMNGFVISNDGSSDLTFTINSMTITVKPNEVFRELFSPFTTVTITTTVPYRAYGLL